MSSPKISDVVSFTTELFFLIKKILEEQINLVREIHKRI